MSKSVLGCKSSRDYKMAKEQLVRAFETAKLGFTLKDKSSCSVLRHSCAQKLNPHFAPVKAESGTFILVDLSVSCVFAYCYQWKNIYIVTIRTELL
ncbi:hypothetical protein L798_00312 [Zootermopsis nevadensis]|uniref:Uncharacterized protein n=1 Tax=Zootermopsis nevadensis TaxID=136037 RepID=A0A067QYL1_ZOONE|nr:hypothetical protein L798_00312 [Zootermopsis nevadensis]